jgi:2-acylglycerol O-acyltransferase 2
MEIKFAPLRVPLKRRLQTAAVTFWICLIPLMLSLFLLLASIRECQPFILAYLVYIYLDPTPELGGRKLLWFRELSVWSYMRDYFPMRIVKTGELDPRRNYVFGYHPHGIISLGAWVNFASEANHFTKMFTGIDLHLMTLSSNFNQPFVREILLSMGLCSVSRQSCDNVLTGGPGKSLMIVIGGAKEVVYARPGINDLIIKKRFGFIKLALRNGSPLVPVFSFGETDLWDQFDNPEGSLLRKFQDKIREITLFNPPALIGRGIFTYNMVYCHLEDQLLQWLEYQSKLKNLKIQLMSKSCTIKKSIWQSCNEFTTRIKTCIYLLEKAN